MDNFQAYGEFARVYDMFQDNVDYDAWGAWLKQQLKEYGILDGLVLDLGCGTGTMTELLAEAGYDMIGVDNSEEMLAEAMEKRVESGHDILYLLQDMQEFELYGTVRAVVSVCDSLNYITEEEELQHFYPEMTGFLGGCRYHNCKHLSEPGCSVRQAVEEGKIAIERYESYKSQMEEIRKARQY